MAPLRFALNGSLAPREAVVIQATTLILAAVIALVASPTPLLAEERTARRPNILLIMTDDQGYGDIGSHGNKQILTPVLDGLAAGGAKFDRFYVSPVCAPTRASLLTGRYHLRTGVHGVTRGHETMRAEETTLAEILRSHGYATGCFGKWHNGAHYPHHPLGQGFEEFFGFCAGHWNNYFDTHYDANGRRVIEEGYITDVLTDRALAFVEEHRKGPWFCYVPYNAPHSPWQVPEEDWQRVRARGITDPELACAYAMCENLDRNIGRLLDRLDTLDLTDNTIVMFLTDNGPNTNRYNGNMRGRKGSLHEGGTRVPCFVRYPQAIQAGTDVKPMAAHIDLLPTLLDLADLPVPNDLELDGVSLEPLLIGESSAWQERTLFTHWGGPLNVKQNYRGAVRTERWRAVKEGRWQLYDMTADPEQSRDVAREHPEVLRQLKQAFETWFAEVTAAGFAEIPTEIGHPEANTVLLPGHEALLEGPADGISYQGRSGWANDYITNWTNTKAYPRWSVKVVRPGRYRVTLVYGCETDDAGLKLAISCGNSQIETGVDQAQQPVKVPSPDRVPRKEVYEFQWAEHAAGTIDLTPGIMNFKIRALAKPGNRGIQLKEVRLERVGDVPQK